MNMKDFIKKDIIYTNPKRATIGECTRDHKEKIIFPMILQTKTVKQQRG